MPRQLTDFIVVLAFCFVGILAAAPVSQNSVTDEAVPAISSFYALGSFESLAFHTGDDFPACC